MTAHLNDLISREEAIRLIMDKAMKENGKKYEHLNDRAYYRYLHGECRQADRENASFCSSTS